MADMYDELTAHVSVGVHLRPTTGLKVASFPHASSGRPFVSMQIGDGAGEIAVMIHKLADLDRLGDLVAEARQSLAHMLDGDTAWERHDDPTVNDEVPGTSGAQLLHAEGWS